MSTPYDTVYQRSLKDPEGFWAEVAEDWTTGAGAIGSRSSTTVQ